MSYDMTLVDPVTKSPIMLDHAHFMSGGTYAIGGTKELWLNVTYNYGGVIRTAIGCGLNDLDGKLAVDTIQLLEEGASKLSDECDDDYWKPVEGNVKKALLQLAVMAKMRPDAVWRVS